MTSMTHQRKKICRKICPPTEEKIINLSDIKKMDMFFLERNCPFTQKKTTPCKKGNKKEYLHKKINCNRRWIYESCDFFLLVLFYLVIFVCMFCKQICNKKGNMSEQIFFFTANFQTTTKSHKFRKIDGWTNGCFDFGPSHLSSWKKNWHLEICASLSFCLCFFDEIVSLKRWHGKPKSKKIGIILDYFLYAEKKKSIRWNKKEHKMCFFFAPVKQPSGKLGAYFFWENWRDGSKNTRINVRRITN